MGVTTLAQSPWDSDTFLVGSEGGLLLRCSFSSQTPAAAPGGRSVPSRAPAVFSFRPSGGPVHSLHFSPFHRYRLRPHRSDPLVSFSLTASGLCRNLFVSGGTDGLVHVHSLLQADPLLSVRVSDSYLFQVQWSPSRPLVFAAATGEGKRIKPAGQRTNPTSPDSTLFSR